MTPRLPRLRSLLAPLAMLLLLAFAEPDEPRNRRLKITAPDTVQIKYKLVPFGA